MVTPNNVSIDGYGLADLRREPIVLNVPSLQTPRWYIVQVGDMFDEVAYDVGGYKGAETGLFLVTGPNYAGPVPANMRQLKVRTQFAVVALRVFPGSLQFVPSAPESLRKFEQIGAGMKMFLSINDDYANPLVMSFWPLGLSVASGFDWKAQGAGANPAML